jgi:hypothetical protein
MVRDKAKKKEKVRLEKMTDEVHLSKIIFWLPALVLQL